MNIVLYQPEIPPNTGNIARTCAVTGMKLHLIEPLGFSLDEKSIKRAGLDYWDAVSIELHSSFEQFIEKYGDNSSLYFCSTHGGKIYSDVDFHPNSFLVFGRETAGLSDEIYSKYEKNLIRIPMLPVKGARSLNLSNAVSIVAYEALRQNGFEGLL